MAAAVLPQLPKGSGQSSDAQPLVVNTVTPGFVPTTGALFKTESCAFTA
jgi:hypothetical protein